MLTKNMPRVFHRLLSAAGRFFSRRRRLKITAAVLIMVLLCGGIWAEPVLSIRAETAPVSGGAKAAPALEKISGAQGDVKVAETETRELYVNEQTLNLRVVDKKTGCVFNAVDTGEGASDDEKSLLILNYLGKDNKAYSWNSWKYCNESKNYTISRMENGVRIVLHLTQGDSTNLDDYMPKRISAERYRTCFLEALETKTADGSIPAEDAEQYKMILETVYQKDDSNDSYYNIFVGDPPLNAATGLIAFSKAVGYTRSMLEKDSAQYGNKLTDAAAASFDVTLEATLDGDDFSVQIPTGAIVTGDDQFCLQKLCVLPNFGLARATDPNCAAGWIFVPDGSGALMKLNSYSAGVSDYGRQLRDSDYYNNYYFKSNYAENITMPVFGMARGKDDASLSGFLGIVEEGAATAGIEAKLGTAGTEKGGRIFNKVYSTVDVMQYSNVKVSGPYSTDNTRYLVLTDPLKFHYRVRYKLFGPGVSYYAMAKAYRQYLIDTTGIQPSYQRSADLYLEAIGTLDLQKRFLGVPYNTHYSMTTCSELTRILERLKGCKTVVNYSGSLGGGKNQRLLRDAAPASANGSRSELTDLINLSEKLGGQMFLEADFSRVYDSGNGFVKRIHSVYGYDNKPVRIYRYDDRNGRFDPSGLNYSRLSPKYLSSVVDSFLPGSTDLPNLFIGDLAADFYADYSSGGSVTPQAADAMVVKNLAKLARSKKIALENPFMDKIRYGSFAADISRESSNYAGFSVSIPFRQLVMNGLIPYSTESVNMSSHAPAYYVLQAVELGAVPKFTVTYKNVDVLKYTPYSYLYAAQFDNLEQEISEVVEQCRQALDAIGSTEIVGSSMVGSSVFRTDYANGKSVLVNYSEQKAAADGLTLPPLGYRIVG